MLEGLREFQFQCIFLKGISGKTLSGEAVLSWPVQEVCLHRMHHPACHSSNTGSSIWAQIFRHIIIPLLPTNALHRQIWGSAALENVHLEFCFVPRLCLGKIAISQDYGKHVFFFLFICLTKKNLVKFFSKLILSDMIFFLELLRKIYFWPFSIRYAYNYLIYMN